MYEYHQKVIYTDGAIQKNYPNSIIQVNILAKIQKPHMHEAKLKGRLGKNIMCMILCLGENRM